MAAGRGGDDNQHVVEVGQLSTINKQTERLIEVGHVASLSKWRHWMMTTTTNDGTVDAS